MNAPVLALSGARLERAFPFHLSLDAELRIRGRGASLGKAMPALNEGMPLAGCFEVSRPRGADSVQAWREHGADLCTLRSLSQPRLSLRGSCEVFDDGTVLLLVSPVLGSMEEMRAHGLAFDDFAPHDAVGEMLLLARSMQTSMDDTQRMATRARRRSQQMDTILELGQNGMVLVDPGGHVLHANGALLRMLDMRREQLPGLTAAALDAHLAGLLEPGQPCGPWFGGAAADPTERAAARGDTPSRVLRLARPRACVVEISARRSEDGALAIYLRDITAEFEVDRMKSEFLTTAAHELRTPMVSVFGFTELLLNRPIDETRRRDVLQTIHRQCGRLITMVNDLLDLARIESRQGQVLQRRSVDLTELVQEAVQAQHVGDRMHRIALSLGTPGTAPATARLDRDKTVQALSNVLSNAVKYSPAGGEIRVDLVPGRLESQPTLGVRVRDPGIGMSAPQLARVFERFYRADPSGNIPGTGLGMSLVKEIVELQGGRIEIDSKEGQGTTVTLWFPLQAEAAAGPATQGRWDNPSSPQSEPLIGPQPSTVNRHPVMPLP